MGGKKEKEEREREKEVSFFLVFFNLFDIAGVLLSLFLFSFSPLLHPSSYLEHRPLDLALATGLRVVPLGADRVDLVDENNRRRHLVRRFEQFADELGPVAEILLDELGSHDAEEGGRGGVGLEERG